MSKLFNLSSIFNDSILVYQWVILSDTFNVKTPVFYYLKDTIYKIELKTVSSMGCRDSINKSVEIYTNPIAGFNVSPVCEGKKSSVFNIRTRSGQFPVTNRFPHDRTSLAGNVAPRSPSENRTPTTVKKL